MIDFRKNYPITAMQQSLFFDNNLLLYFNFGVLEY